MCGLPGPSAATGRSGRPAPRAGSPRRSRWGAGTTRPRSSGVRRGAAELLVLNPRPTSADSPSNGTGSSSWAPTHDGTRRMTTDRWQQVIRLLDQAYNDYEDGLVAPQARRGRHAAEP